MALCKNNCGNEAKGRSMYCSDTCKTLYNRNKKSVTTPVVTETVTVGGVSCLRKDLVPCGHDFSLKVFHDNPSDFAIRDKPEKLNWGPWMSLSELESSSFIANRVSIPGDFDYSGTFN